MQKAGNRWASFVSLRARMCILLVPIAALIALLASGSLLPAAQKKSAPSPGELRVEVSYAKSLSAQPLDGRMYFIVSKDSTAEPRLQINYFPDSQQFFGVDVDALAAEKPVVFDSNVLGYPRESLKQIPPGDYFVQGLLNIYETFHRADGRLLKLPMDHWEGQQWSRKPGNLYSKPQKAHIDPSAGGVVPIELTEVIPPLEPPKDTKYIKHLRIQSPLLTKFWGRPMELGAHLLLPEGWAEHPDAHYPLLVYQGHFSEDFFGGFFRTELPKKTGEKSRSALWEEYGYKFYQDWTSGRLPRMIILEIQHANPYYDDSYAVNSANVGPYGDAITQELILLVEKKYRGIGQGWARALYGGSTGGWEALGMQVFYPDFFNGTYCLCPDPVDFRAYQLVNLYEDKNAFWHEGPWAKIPVPGARKPDGLITATSEGMARFELVLGTHGRSTEQFDIWQAVFGPVGDDGYPKLIWDPRTGVIDHDVAAYWREHYDLRYILERDWKTLGPKLVGKLHVTVGTRDTFYLDNAVRLLENFLKNTNNPYYAGDFDYGPHQPHCYTGDSRLPSYEGFFTLHQRIMPKLAEWMDKTAPPGSDTKSWKY